MSKVENPDVPKVEVQPDPIPPAPKPISACNFLEEILKNPPGSRVVKTGGGYGISGGDITYRAETYAKMSDEAALETIRALAACQQGLVLNPLNPDRYVRPEEHGKIHNDAWRNYFDKKKTDEQRRKARREEGCCIQ